MITKHPPVLPDPDRVPSDAAPQHGHPADQDVLPPHASAHLLSTSVSRLNRLRAAVLGCDDGITSTAGLVVGVARPAPAPPCSR